MPMLTSSSTLIACNACDLLVDICATHVGQKGCCPRCGTTLYVKKANSITNIQALCLSGLFLSFPAFFWPIMTLNAVGNEAKGSLFDAVVSFATGDYVFVAIVVLLTSIVFPIIRFLFLLVVSSFLKTTFRPSFLKPLFRFALHMDEWAMLDIYVIGIGVTLVKVHGLASVGYNVALFCLIGVTLLNLLISSKLDKERFWSKLTGKSTATVDLVHDQARFQTGKQAGLMACHHCESLNPVTQIEKDEQQLCTRCESPVHLRKSNSIVNTWALLITAIILFIPANVLPIMRVYFWGTPKDSTIMDGIIYFFQHGSVGIGLIILTASIIVPLFKMVGLFILLVTIKLRLSTSLKTKIKMFHVIEFIGRWSMLDIFVIALMGVLIDFGSFTSIVAAPAATYFCLVVIATMFSATTFDSRLLWDNCEIPQDYVSVNKDMAK